jgi:hypothetical protein
MSRANRRRAQTRPVQRTGATATVERSRPRPVAQAPGASGSERHISWRHCLLGTVVGEALLLILSNAGIGVANFAFGGTGDRADGGIVGVATFVAVIVGGFIAARMAGRWGIYQGIVVAVGFILVSVVYQFVQEATVVHQALTSGSRSLVDLGPMRIDNIISGDLLVLFGGSFGGWLSRR